MNAESSTSVAVVFTTIHPPNTVTQSWSSLVAGKSRWGLIAVGDKKTPKDWHQPGCAFISVDQQQEWKACRLASMLPVNHYSRKMLGYIWAAQQGARVIVDTDDDNCPLPRWFVPIFGGWFQVVESSSGFVNVYDLFGAGHLWPRGYPLSRVRQSTRVQLRDEDSVKVGVWQGLVNGDPDIDAVCRMTQQDPTADFAIDQHPCVLGFGTVCPFNSQNTAFRKELFELLYLPSTVSFRFTDILRGLIAQPIMWSKGYRLGFTTATAFQKRNDHDLMDDFRQEVPMHAHSDTIAGLVTKAINSADSVGESLMKAYDVMCRKGIVDTRELVLLSAWLKDINP